MAYRPRDRIWEYDRAPRDIIPLADLKAQMRIDIDAEDDLVSGFGGAAVALVERHTQRLLSPRTCTLSLTSLPFGSETIELPGGRVTSVTSVEADGAEILGCVAKGHSPAVLIPPSDWPVVTGQGYPVTITYVAGEAEVPDDLVAAVKLIAAELDQRRSDGVEGSISRAPISAELLMRPHRIAPVR